jgi:iron complex outermembrane recepter protein
VVLLICVILSAASPMMAMGVQPEDWIRTPGELKQLSLEELMNQTVVSVSRQAEALSDAPAAVTVITQEDIRRSGATSLPEALRLAPNLEVAQVSSHEWAISARGFNNTAANKMLVMIDGRTVYTPLFAGVFWDVQDTLLEDIDRIEVISGPGGTLWGANAVNGVINVITKSAKDTQGGLLLGGGGAELNGFGGVRYGGQLAEHVYYRVYAKYFDRDSTLFADGLQATNAWNMGQGGFRVDWEAPGENNLTFQGDYCQGGVAQPQSPHIDLSGGNSLGRWTHSFSEQSDLTVQMYYDHTHRRIPNTFTEDLDTYDLDAQHRFALGDRNQVVWGLGYRTFWDDVQNSPVLAFLPPHLNHQVFSTFVQDRIKLIDDRLYLTLGSKFEHNDYTGFEFQPNLRLAWMPAGRQTVWAAVSRAVRTPSRIDRDFYVPGVPPFSLLQGGPDFESEKLIAHELGYRVQPVARLALSLTGFYHDYDDLRSTEPLNPPVPFPVVIANGLRGETYGAELAADYKVTDWWRLRAGYTELRVHLSPKPGSVDMSNGSNESHDPNRQVSLWSFLDLPAHLELDTGFRYVSQIANQNVPAYSEMDARLAWQVRRNLELAVVGQNLLHSHHIEFGAPANRYEIERVLYGKVTWRF